MLPQKYRIDSKLIPTITKRGVKADKDGVTYRLWYENDMQNPRGAFIISTKIDKRAVVRNRIKRIFRSAFYHLAKNGKLRNMNFVFIIKDKKWEEKSSDDVLEFLKQMIGKQS
jgi:ribonuclease P protein component